MKVNTKAILASLVLSIGLIGCGSNSSNSTDTTMADANNSRFMKMTMMEQNVIQDTKTGLEWVDGNNKAGVSSGCNPQGAGHTKESIKEVSEQFCSDLVFASHEDWRTATPAEHQEYITQMQKAGKIPFYANPSCPRLVGLDNNGEVKSVNTHNTQPIGAMTPWDDLPLASNNVGIKCVRKF